VISLWFVMALTSLLAGFGFGVVTTLHFVPRLVARMSADELARFTGNVARHRHPTD